MFVLRWILIWNERQIMMDQGVRIKDLPLKERPRERLMAIGAEALDNTDLVPFFCEPD